MSIVLDASAALAWVFERADPAEGAQAMGWLAGLSTQDAIVPEPWHLEVANALIIGQRRGVVSIAKATDFLSRLRALPIRTQPTSFADQKEHLFSLGREHELTADGAAYLNLALQTGLALATFDRRLAVACAKAGVHLA